MKKKQKLHSRVFLNNRNGMAALEARVYINQPYHEQHGSYSHGCSASLAISDCGQTITIDFDCASDEKHVKERLAKVDRIRHALDLIEQGIIESYINGATPAEVKAVHEAHRRAQGGSNAPSYLDID